MVLVGWIEIGYLLIGLLLASIFNGFLKGDLGAFLFLMTIFAWPVVFGALALGGLLVGISCVGHKIGEWIANLF